MENRIVYDVNFYGTLKRVRINAHGKSMWNAGPISGSQGLEVAVSGSAESYILYFTS